MFSIPTLHGSLSKLISEKIPNITFNGSIYKAITDVDGSIYVCGNFTNVEDTITKKSRSFTSLNQTDSSISAASRINFNNIVTCFAIDGEYAYVAGDFTIFNDITRNRIAKIHIPTGELDTVFDPGIGFDNIIRTIAIDGNSLYVGGSFATYKGKTRLRLVKIDKNTAAEIDAEGTGFSTASGFNGQIYSFTVDNTNLYIGGAFTSYKGNTRQYIVKIDKTTAAEVDTNGTGFSTTSGFGEAVTSFAVDGNNLYVGGGFTTYKGNTRQCIVKIDKTTAAEVDANGTGFSTTSGFNSTANFIAIDGNSLYIGGSFTTYKGNTRQRLVKIDKTTAAEVDTNGTGFSTTSGFNGNVVSLTISGNSLYIGGSFTTYKGNTRQRLVKIDKTTAAEVDANGTGFSAFIGFDNQVYSVITSGNNLYVGGSFSAYKNDSSFTRQRIAKINKETKTIDTVFDPGIGFNQQVESLVIDGNSLYVGGFFTTYKGNTRQYIVKIDKTTAAEVDTNGTGFSTTSGFNGNIYSIVVDGNNLYVGGNFTSYKGNSRRFIAKIDKTTAAEVDTNGTGFSTTSGFNSTVNFIAIDGNSLYVGGSFVTYKEFKRQRLVKIDKTTAELDFSFQTIGGFNSQISSLIVDADDIYLVGSFTTYQDPATQKSVGFALINKANSSLVSSIAQLTIDGIVYCSVLDGDYIYIGGDFFSYNGILRNRIAKIHIPTGELDTVFDPGTGFNRQVNSLAIDGNNLYIGGAFTSYKGNTRQYIVKIDKTTAAEVDTNGTGFSTTDGFGGLLTQVLSLVIDGNNLYVGGNFLTYKGNDRQCLVKIDKTTAAIDVNFNTVSGFNERIYSLAIDGSNLYAAGVFTNYKGNTRQHIVKIDKTTAAEVDANGTGFSTTSGFNSYPHSIAIDGNNLYAAGVFTTYKGNTRQHIVKIDKTTAAVDVNFNTLSGFNQRAYSLAINGDNLYVGGNFTTYKGNTRQFIAKIDKTTAAEVDTNGTGFSTISGFNGNVWSIVADSNNLYVGGDFTNYKNDSVLNRTRIAKINKNTAALDNFFDSSSGLNSSANTILLNENSIYVGGSFTSYKGIGSKYVVKVDKTTAAIDSNFDTLNGADGIVYSILQYSTNILFLTGNFINYKNASVAFNVFIKKQNASIITSGFKIG